MLPVATLDLETDPFEYNVQIKPFVSGYYDGEKFVSIWHRDCIRKTVAMLKTQEPKTIYIHNGGRFDLFFFMPYICKGTLRIINNRIVECNMPSSDSGSPHVIRDSYSIMPFPLREYDKDEIDYELMRPGTREAHKEQITKYLKKDCTSLHELCEAFVAEFGNKLTIGSAALTELKRFHKFKCFPKVTDNKFRSHFYFGGRCQVFKSGITECPLEIIDVNSMYPDVMRSRLHPIGTEYSLSKRIERNTCFVVAEGTNDGAFPTRTKTGGLDFTVETGTFFTTIHEWEAAQETRSFRCKRIIRTYGFDDRICFDEFVNHFYAARVDAKLSGDKIHALFYKFVLNSAYGKFAQNGDNFYDWQICDFEQIPEGWKASADFENKYTICRRPALTPRFNNVCTGSSITGAARAVLLRGIHSCATPLYCDTDSIICRESGTNRKHDTELGYWKVEAIGTRAAIAGKKMYAVWNGDKLVKKAHKGGRLTGEQIETLALGGTVEIANPVPCLKFTGKDAGSMKFTTRKFRRTDGTTGSRKSDSGTERNA